MTDESTGLPSDNVEGDLTDHRRLHLADQHRRLPVVHGDRARPRHHLDREMRATASTTTLTTLETLERNTASGMFYNWYDPATGAKLTTWPDSGDAVDPFLSTVDNGWLAASLRIVREAEPRLAERADACTTRWTSPRSSTRPGARTPRRNEPRRVLGGRPCGMQRRGADVQRLGRDRGLLHCHHYDTTVSESRIATYLGIANGRSPRRRCTARTAPCPRMRLGVAGAAAHRHERTYQGFDVWEGVYSYRGMKFVPSWGGSMFESLMPDLLVPETKWGARSWRLNHPITVAVQKQHGLDDAGYGAWGFSPASDPFGGYAEYGVDLAGMRSDGYISDHEKTDVDIDRPGCTVGTNPDPEFGDGVVTPHASFLALPYDRKGVLKNLRPHRDRPRRIRPRRLLRRRGGRERHGGRALPVAGPVDDHGRDRQRPDRR